MWARSPGAHGRSLPSGAGPFIRAARNSTEPARELVIGQWGLILGLIPWFARSAKLAYSTNNARSEELSTKASYKHSWQYGIPAMSFDEPNWETGKNIWWRFRRADGAPWALAGLWNTWTDKGTGEMVESYTMLTLKADEHPLMSRTHKPDPKLGPDAQDKRSVVPIELEDVDAWLHGNHKQAQALVRLAPAEAFDAGPVDR
jgi:putative SOS response-associated peptidase YedK